MPSDMSEVFEMRKKVMEAAFPGLSLSLSGDYLDDHASYITCREKATDELVASCRLIDSEPFYSDYEFDMKSFYERAGKVLEVSRFCVDESARQGRVTMLMMRALAAAALYTESSYLFGMTSAPVDYSQDNIRHWIFENGHMLKDFDIKKLVPAVKNDGKEKKIPPLMKAYISFGAKVFLEPAYDPIFEVYDYMTIMKTSDIDPRITSRIKK